MEMLPYTYFNETVFQFVEDLRDVFKRDPLLVVVCNGIKLYAKTKPMSLQHGFGLVIDGYVQRIEDCDEDFFLNHTVAEYKSDYNRIKGNLEDEITTLKKEINVKRSKGISVFTKVVDYIKSHWKTMDPENKEIIWQYMHQLLKLHKICEERK